MKLVIHSHISTMHTLMFENSSQMLLGMWSVTMMDLRLIHDTERGPNKPASIYESLKSHSELPGKPLITFRLDFNYMSALMALARYLELSSVLV